MKPRRTFRVYEAEYMEEGYIAKVRATSAAAAIGYVERHEEAYRGGVTELVAIRAKKPSRPKPPQKEKIRDDGGKK